MTTNKASVASKPIANTYSEQIRLINPAKPIKLYRNLRTGLFSVFQATVKFHTKNLFLRDVTFLVNEKGRQRVLATRQKNVHSFVQGYLTDISKFLSYTWTSTANGRDSYVRYNPYESPYFMTAGLFHEIWGVQGGGIPVKSAEMCGFSKEGESLRVFAKGIEFAKSERSELDTIEDCDMIRESVAQHLL